MLTEGQGVWFQDVPGSEEPDPCGGRSLYFQGLMRMFALMFAIGR